MSRKLSRAALPALAALAFSFPVAGAALAETTVRPRLAAEERYDSNPAFATDASPSFVTTLSPGVSAAAGSRTLNLKGDYELGAVFYHDDPGLDYTAHSADLEAAFTGFAGAMAEFKDSFRKEMDSLSALDSAVQTERTGIITNTAGVRFLKEATARAALEFALEDTLIDFDDPSFVDTRSDEASAAWRYKFTDRSDLILGYAYTRYRFETDAADDADVHKAAVELTRKFSETLSARLSAGIVIIGADEAKTDWTVDASVAKDLKGATLSAGLTRDVTHSSGLSGELSVVNRLNIGVTKTLGESSGLGLSLSLADSGSEPSGELDASSYGAEASYYWQFREWMRLSGGYSRFQQWAEGGSAEDFARDQVFIRVTFTPVDWRI